MARTRKGSAKSKTSVSINFKGVEQRKTPPEGDYIVEVEGAEKGVSSNKNDQIEFIFAIARGEYKGQKLYFYCPLAENSLWKLAGLLTALGEDVPDDEMDIDLEELVGKQCVAVVHHETYDGSKRAKMGDFDSIENYEGDDAEDDKKSSSKKGAKGKKLPQLDKAEVEEMTAKELQGVIDKYELEVDLDDHKKLPAKVEAVVEALEEGDHLEADEEPAPKGKGKKKDEDDEPAAKGKAKGKGKAKKKTYTTEEIQEMDEDELQAVIDEHDDIDVDLDDAKTLKKKVALVIDALEEEDMIED